MLHLPAVQDWPDGQGLQLIMLPQPSPIVPHIPVGQVVIGVQLPLPHLPVPPPPQAWPDGQEPQLMVFPHPSPCVPQVYPWPWQVSGVQPLLAHLPPTQFWPEGQVPHMSGVLVQPSPISPQLAPCSAQVLGVQVGGVTHEPRSKSMNSRIFSCGVIVALAHSFGKVVPPVEGLFSVSSTWKSS